MTSPNTKKSKDTLFKKKPLKEIGLFVLDILYNAVIIIFLVVIIRSFLISPFRVIGSSMADTLSNGEFILIDKLSYNLGDPKRGDPIVFLPPITNKYPYKFQETITTDAKGLGKLDIDILRTEKKVFYCQNKLIKKIWLCRDKVKSNDLIYFTKNTSDGQNADWKQANKKLVTANEIKEQQLIINGNPNQTYLIRIYNSTGPEYFVKRIIGIPGDTIRIENGRVYLSMQKNDKFIEIDEIYLNEENKFNTYLQKTSGVNEFKVPQGKYFVMGDNRNHSNDSRHWFSPIDENYSPYVNMENINGKVMIVLWPPQKLRLIPSRILQ